MFNVFNKWLNKVRQRHFLTTRAPLYTAIFELGFPMDPRMMPWKFGDDISNG